MELLFSDLSLQRTLEYRVRVDDRFGHSDGAVVRQRVCELLAADSLAVVETLHTLDLRTVDAAIGTFSVQLTARCRLHFVVALDPIPRLRRNGQIDLAQVGAIRVVELQEM
jgi:hypothetical protein